MSYRKVSTHNQDQSFLNPNDSSFMNHNSTTRSISSSSASMISTPSNNIRKLQHQHQNQDTSEGHSGQHEAKTKLRTTTNLVTKGKNQYLKPKKSANVNLVKNKLLNLQKSSKIYTKSNSVQAEEEDTKHGGNKKVFVLRKPVNMNFYDYSVFRDYPEGEKFDDSLPPAVKESQIKAWESAEKITNNLIFENDSDLTDDDEFGTGGVTNESLNDSVKPLDGAISTFPGTNNNPPGNTITSLIKSIPGYTKGELDIIGTRFEGIQQLGQLDEFGPKLYEDEEKKLLYQFRNEQQASQGKVFNQYQSLNGKRKLQVLQKKDLLNKMFGYNNVLNQEYITNNTSYSSLDNVMNISKAYQEDKQEVDQLAKEDQLFQLSLEESRTHLDYVNNHIFSDLDTTLNALKRNKNIPKELDNEQYHELVTDKLTRAYNDRKPDPNDDFNNFALSYLRKCIKNDEDNDHDL